MTTIGQTPLRVREIGSFYVGGEMRRLEGLPTRERISTPGGPVHPINPNGEIAAGQMYVQYVRLDKPQSSVPLLMWHGGGMSGVTWETTPDGRPGWQMFFLRAGFDTYISDAVERGRASWAPYPQVYPEAPYFRTAKEIWEDVFRFGPAGSWDADPAKRRTHPNLRFPAAHFEAFFCQSVPRWGCNDALTQRAYDALLQRLDDGVVILTHSQGGNFGMMAALHAPERVRAVISLEPSGAPDSARQDARLLRDVPHLFVWGDYLDQHSFWPESRPSSERWRDALQNAGCAVTWTELPALDNVEIVMRSCATITAMLWRLSCLTGFATTCDDCLRSTQLGQFIPRQAEHWVYLIGEDSSYYARVLVNDARRLFGRSVKDPSAAALASISKGPDNRKGFHSGEGHSFSARAPR